MDVYTIQILFVETVLGAYSLGQGRFVLSLNIFKPVNIVALRMITLLGSSFFSCAS